jgi:hypothetical protein
MTAHGRSNLYKGTRTGTLSKDYARAYSYTGRMGSLLSGLMNRSQIDPQRISVKVDFLQLTFLSFGSLPLP